MRMYRGDEPCAGCGRAGSEYSRRHKADICYECKELIKLGKGVKAETDEYARFSWNTNSHNKNFTYRESEHKYHRTETAVYVSNDYGIGGSSGDLARGLTQLLDALDVGDKAKTSIDIRVNDRIAASRTVYIGKNTALALFAFWDAIARYSRACYKDGQKDGDNMIVRLARGDLTIDRLNELQTKKR